MTETLTLEQHGYQPIQPTSFAEILAALAQIDPKISSFVILSQSDGSYLQTAGSRLRLTLEYRQITGATFKHYVLGRPPVSEVAEYIECNVGPIKVYQHEVLTLDDALEVFKTFFESLRISQGYLLRDTTAMFLEM